MKTLDYERYLFRITRQDPNENLQSFVQRLESQLLKCHFADPEAQLKDQIIEKCIMNDLRRDAFGQVMTLEQLILRGKTLESAQINSTSERLKNYAVPSGIVRECSRCGSKAHMYFNKQCPALKSSCKVCQKIGHFARMCHSNNQRLHRNAAGNCGDIKKIPKRAPKLLNETSLPADKETSPNKSLANITTTTNVATSLEESPTEISSPAYFEVIHEVFSPSSSTHPGKSPANSPAIKQEKEVQSPKQSISTNSEQGGNPTTKAHDCTVGGMPAQLVVRTFSPSSPVNVMSKGLFRKLRVEKHKFFTSEMFPVTMGDKKYCGHFTAKLKIANLWAIANFYVEEGTHETVYITDKQFQRLTSF